jgi:hypothetical protein
VERQEPINMSTTGRRRMLRLLGSVGEELLAEQYVIVARST